MTIRLFSEERNKVMSKVRLILSAIIIIVIILVGVWMYSWIKGVPVFELFRQDNKMERTATILRSIRNTHRWVFLTVEDEEVVVKEHTFGNVAKIYPSYYEFGIEFDDSLKWVEIQEHDGVKVASLHLPPIKILNKDALDATKVINIYGEADDAEQVEMKRIAQFKLKRRAMSGGNIEQAERNARGHFQNLFTVLECDSVKIEWQSK